MPGEIEVPAHRDREAHVALHVAAGEPDLGEPHAAVPGAEPGAQGQLGPQHQPAAEAHVLARQAAPGADVEAGDDVRFLREAPAPLPGEPHREDPAIVALGRAVHAGPDGPGVVDGHQVVQGRERRVAAIGHHHGGPVELQGGGADLEVRWRGDCFGGGQRSGGQQGHQRGDATDHFFGDFFGTAPGRGSTILPPPGGRSGHGNARCVRNARTPPALDPQAA